MLLLDQTLFLALNASPDTAPLVLLLARGASLGAAPGLLLLLAWSSLRTSGAKLCWCFFWHCFLHGVQCVVCAYGFLFLGQRN